MCFACTSSKKSKTERKGSPFRSTQVESAFTKTWRGEGAGVENTAEDTWGEAYTVEAKRTLPSRLLVNMDRRTYIFQSHDARKGKRVPVVAARITRVTPPPADHTQRYFDKKNFGHHRLPFYRHSKNRKISHESLPHQL